MDPKFRLNFDNVKAGLEIYIEVSRANALPTDMSFDDRVRRLLSETEESTGCATLNTGYNWSQVSPAYFSLQRIHEPTISEYLLDTHFNGDSERAPVAEFGKEIKSKILGAWETAGFPTLRRDHPNFL